MVFQVGIDLSNLHWLLCVARGTHAFFKTTADCRDPRLRKFWDSMDLIFPLKPSCNCDIRKVEAEETRAVYVPLAERFGVHIWKTEFEEPIEQI